jgi:hypothetical protein
MKYRNHILTSILTASFFLFPATGETQTFTFRNVADTDTLVPGGVGTFASFPIADDVGASIDNGNVAFSGVDATTGDRGIYAEIGGVLEVIADFGTIMPPGIQPIAFDSLGIPSIDGDNVAFAGQGQSGNRKGVYKKIGADPLSLVANLDTTIPEIGGTFGGTFFGTQIDGGNVVFLGDCLGLSGADCIVAEFSGVLELIARRGTSIPGTANLPTFGFFPSIDGVDVAFTSSTGDQPGVYQEVGGVPGTVADDTTPIPGGAGLFSFLGGVSLSGGYVAFPGGAFGDPGQEGIYTNTGGFLNVVANGNTLIPEGKNNFERFLNTAAFDSGNIAFTGGRTDGGSKIQQGIYTNLGGSLKKVIDLTDTLDGKNITFIKAGNESLSGDEIAFYVEFDDGSAGIYVATFQGNPVFDIDVGVARFQVKKVNTGKCTFGSAVDPCVAPVVIKLKNFSSGEVAIDYDVTLEKTDDPILEEAVVCSGSTSGALPGNGTELIPGCEIEYPVPGQYTVRLTTLPTDGVDVDPSNNDRLKNVSLK